PERRSLLERHSASLLPCDLGDPVLTSFGGLAHLFRRLPHFFVSPGVGDTRVVTTNLCCTWVSFSLDVSSRPEHKRLRKCGRAAIHGRDRGVMDALQGWPGLKPQSKAQANAALKSRSSTC